MWYEIFPGLFPLQIAKSCIEHPNSLQIRPHQYSSKILGSIAISGIKSISKYGLKNPQAKECKIKSPDSKIFNMCINEFFREYGKTYNVTKSFLRGIANGIVKNNKGWQVKYTWNKFS